MSTIDTAAMRADHIGGDYMEPDDARADVHMLCNEIDALRAKLADVLALCNEADAVFGPGGDHLDSRDIRAAIDGPPVADHIAIFDGPEALR